MPISDLNRTKFEELLLNKVQNLHWYYFQLDLNTQLPESNGFQVSPSQKTFESVLECIEVDEFGEYFYGPGPQEINAMVGYFMEFINKEPDLLEKAMDRIFKTNRIVSNSASDQGQLGKLNAVDKSRRRKRFWRRINEGFRTKSENYIVLAEGDSWFQFPAIKGVDVVSDIVDQLHGNDQFNVYSLAAGGDWLSNILHTGEYIEELPLIRPDVFLISGGGNDMVGGKRLATMVYESRMPPSAKMSKLHVSLVNLRTFESEGERHKYQTGIKYLNEEFFNFINLIFLQYFVFFHNLIVRSDKYKNMLFITQGYDYAIPSPAKWRTWWNPLQGLVNWFNNSGNWLYTPLMLRGISDPYEQRSILFAMITEFNEVLAQLANFNGFSNLFHIDVRGFAQDGDWFDELHLKSSAFEKVSEVFQSTIRENAKKNAADMSKIKLKKVKDLTR